MILQQLVRQFFRDAQAFPSFLVLLVLYTHGQVIFSCMWKSLTLSSSDSSQKFESEYSDNLGLLQLLIANSDYSIRWSFESSFSLSTVARSL